MPSILDALNEEMTRIQKLSELIAEDPKMEETILKFVGKKMDGPTNGAHNSRQHSRHPATTDSVRSSTLTRTITFIRRNGPSTRKEILEGTEMAEGSFVHFMRDSGRFHQGEDGRWELKN